MLSTKLARRARPPLGVCHPQGLVLPLTSVVDRMTSLSGSLKESPSATATADASTTRTSSERAIRARDERDRDQPQQAFHGGVGANGATAAALTAGAGHTGFESFLISVLQHALQPSPMPRFELAKRLTLGHRPASFGVGPGTRRRH